MAFPATSIRKPSRCEGQGYFKGFEGRGFDPRPGAQSHASGSSVVEHQIERVLGRLVLVAALSPGGSARPVTTPEVRSSGLLHLRWKTLERPVLSGTFNRMLVVRRQGVTSPLLEIASSTLVWGFAPGHGANTSSRLVLTGNN